MIRSEIESFLENISIPSRKVFVYKQEFLPDEYITVEKTFKSFEGTEHQYKIIESESTYVIPHFSYDLFYTLLAKEELVLCESGKWYMSIKDYKCQSCCCGAWATINPEHHSFWCRKYMK